MKKDSQFFNFPKTLIISSSISAFSILLAVFDPDITRIICIFAMLISTLGDIILSDYKPIVSRLPMSGFLAGGSVFAVAHGVYILAFLYRTLRRGYTFFNIGAYIGFAIFIIIAAYLAIIFKRNNLQRRMIVFAFIYLVLICFNCTCVFSLASSEGGLKILSSIGAFSFLISDLFIALDVFCAIKIPHRSKLIWTFYPIGQFLLLLGA